MLSHLNSRKKKKSLKSLFPPQACFYVINEHYSGDLSMDIYKRMLYIREMIDRLL